MTLLLVITFLDTTPKVQSIKENTGKLYLILRFKTSGLQKTLIKRMRGRKSHRLGKKYLQNTYLILKKDLHP